MRVELLICCCCVSSAACFTTTYVTKHPVGADTEFWHHNFVAGFVETGAPVDLRDHCPEGVARVKTEVSFVNGVLSGVVNGVTSYALDIVIDASVSDLDDGARAGIVGGYNVASTLFNPIWWPSTLKVTCIGGGGSAEDPPAPDTSPAPVEPATLDDGLDASLRLEPSALMAGRLGRSVP